MNMARKTCVPAVLLSALSCASRLPDYSKRHAEECRAHAAAEAIAVGVDPIESSDTCAEYFGIDLTRGGVIPLYVLVENRSNSSFLVDANSFDVHVADSQARLLLKKPHDDAGADKVADAFSGAYILSGGLMLPLGVIGGRLKTSENEAKRNLARKEFAVRTISPHGIADGFVFIQLPADKEDHSLAISVRLDGLDKGSGGSTIVVPFLVHQTSEN